ncbi:MAG: HD domain-containing protein [Candidatus Omnitrophica bacterium]|nr:HD domain-containing protein [Candidatus Omnitrophota bacterium]
MVRIINILKKNWKKAVGASDRDYVASPAPEPELSPLPSAQMDAPLTGTNPYRRKPSVAEAAAEARAIRERLERFHALYRNLHAMVCLALGGVIHRDKVEETIGQVADAFEAEPFNELLLLFYSFSRKNYLTAHIVNDVILTVGFARSLGYERREMLDLGISAFAHDLGMAHFEGIARKGQQLTAQEIEDIKQHPMRSSEMVRPIFAEKIASAVLDVHERENGQGYPRGIPGAEIHLWAKIIAVCDTFEALTHPRIFRSPYSPYEAMKIIIKKKDVLFDDTVVKRFIDFMSIYPVGTLVYLNSGELALVTGSNYGSPTRAVVRVLINENREIEEGNQVIDLARQDFVYISGVVEPEKEKEILYFLKPRGQVELDDV